MNQLIYRTLLFLFFVSYNLLVQAQNVFAPEVNQLVLSKEKDILKLNKVLYKYKNDSVKILEFAQYSKKSNYPIGEIFAYNTLGKIYRIKTNFPKAIYYHEKAYDRAVEVGNLYFQIYSLNMLGVVYRRMDAVKSALEYHNKALEIARNVKIKDRHIIENIAISHNSIGNIYLLLQKDDLALIHFNKALKIEKRFDNKLGLAINNQNIGFIHEREGELDKALIYYHNSLDYNSQIHSKVGEIICNISIGNIYLKKNNPKKALEIVQPNIKLAEDLGDNYYIVDVYTSLAEIYIKLRQYHKAESFLHKSLELAVDKNMPSEAAKGYKLLSELYEKKGNFRASLVYHKKYTTEENKVLNEKNRQLVSDLIIKQLKHENSKKLKALDDENLMVKQKLRFTKRYSYFVLALLFLLSILVFILYKQYKLNNQRKLMDMEQNLLRAQMNPHFIFNTLNSIKLFIIKNRQKDAVTYLSKFAKLVRAILQSTTDKETTLAEEIAILKLYVSIENVRFLNEIDFDIEVDPKLDTGSIQIPSLFTQPYIENAIWHGLSPKEGIKKLSIDIYEKDATHFVIEIIDNGIGRERAMKIKQSRSFMRTSIGLELSKERLKYFSRIYKNDYNIQFVDLKDKQDKPIGTKVIITVPYK